MRNVHLPDTPPPLDQQVNLTDRQVEQIGAVLTKLSAALDGLPVIISQQGHIVGAAGAGGDLVAERLARVADRMWREGASYTAREVVRFEEEYIEEAERAAFLVYSVHIASALILTIGWQMTVSLTQLRAEVSDAKGKLLKIVQ